MKETLPLVVKNQAECLTIALKTGKAKVYMISCNYRSSTSNIGLFSELIERMLILIGNKAIFICVDSNIDLINPLELKSIDNFHNTMSSMGLFPKSTKTREIKKVEKLTSFKRKSKIDYYIKKLAKCAGNVKEMGPTLKIMNKDF